MSLVVAIMAISLSLVNGQTCPLPNLHCDCSDAVSGVVHCSDVNNVPVGLPNNTVWLDLDGNVVGPVLFKMQVDSLGVLKLTNLFLSNNKIQAIEDKAFAMLYLVTELDLSGNELTGLTDNTLLGLKSLKSLYMANNKLRVLPLRMFEQVPKLEYLDLENNMLSSIGREFSTLGSLVWLYLAANQLTDITREGFVGLTSLNHLSLFDNKLTVAQPTWFGTIAENNGTLEMDRRLKTNTIYPNKWLCCSDVIPYYYFLAGISRTEKSYDQMNLVCSWLVKVSGRLMATLSENELSSVPCSDFTTSTTEFVFTTTPSVTTTTPCKGSGGGSQLYTNFMASLNDAGAFFILLLLAVAGGLIVGLGCYFKHNKKSRVAVQEFMMSMRAEMNGNSHKVMEKSPALSSRPYKQDRTVYGSSGEVVSSRPNSSETTLASAPDLRISNKRFANVIGDSTDHSEDEVWNARQKRQPL